MKHLGIVPPPSRSARRTGQRIALAAAVPFLACAMMRSSELAPDLAPAIAAGAAPAVRNVLLVVIDTLRADHLGCYGYPRATSPRIDRLALESVRFEHCSTAWPETCQSMAAMLTGTWPQTNGVVLRTPAAAPESIDFVAEIAQRAGIATAGFVSNDVLLSANRFNQGCDTWVEQWNPKTNPRKKADVDLACEWIRDHRDQRFWCWVHLIEPHAPYAPKEPERFVGDSLYDPTRKVEVRPPTRPFDAMGGIPGFSRLDGHDELDYYVARYDSEIVDADAKVGQLLDQLGSLGLSDDTAVIVVADHGEGFGEHGYYWHGYVPFRETSRVPLIVRVPGMKPGVAHEITSTVDLAPTMLQLLGLPRSKQHEGLSLVPQLADPALKLDRTVFVESGYDGTRRSWQRSVRERRFKLVHVPSAFERHLLKLEEYQLYDIEDDPRETTDVSEQHPEVVARLKAELFAWMRDEPLYDAKPAELSPEEIERIRAEGYGAGADEKPHGGGEKRDER